VGSLPEHLKPISVGRRPLPREVLEARQRERIIEAAIDVFAGKGYPAATVDDLVAAAQIGVGSFYGHFGGKEECLIASYEMVVAEATDFLIARASPTADWLDRICLGLGALLDWIAANPDRAKVALVEIQAGTPAARARYEETLARAAAVLAEGRRAVGVERRLPDSLEQTITSGIAWLLDRRLAAGEASTIPDLYAELGQFALEPYVGRRRATAALGAHAPSPTA